MIGYQVPVGAVLGALLSFGGARLSGRWLEKLPASWSIYAATGFGGIAAGILAYVHPLDNYFWQQLILIGIVVTAALVDLHERIIPNELMIFGLAIGLAVVFVLPYPGKTWVSALEGAAGGFAFLLALALLVKGGMGLGDVKLAGVIGLYLGFQWMVMGLIFAFLSGGFVGALLLLLRVVKRKDYIPFGPYLALGALVTALYGVRIWDWYMGF